MPRSVPRRDLEHRVGVVEALGDEPRDARLELRAGLARALEQRGDLRRDRAARERLMKLYLVHHLIIPCA